MSRRVSDGSMPQVSHGVQQWQTKMLQRRGRRSPSDSSPNVCCIPKKQLRLSRFTPRHYSASLVREQSAAYTLVNSGAFALQRLRIGFSDKRRAERYSHRPLPCKGLPWWQAIRCRLDWRINEQANAVSERKRAARKAAERTGCLDFSVAGTRRRWGKQTTQSHRRHDQNSHH